MKDYHWLCFCHFLLLSFFFHCFFFKKVFFFVIIVLLFLSSFPSLQLAQKQVVGFQKILPLDLQIQLQRIRDLLEPEVAAEPEVAEPEVVNIPTLWSLMKILSKTPIIVMVIRLISKEPIHLLEIKKIPSQPQFQLPLVPEPEVLHRKWYTNSIGPEVVRFPTRLTHLLLLHRRQESIIPVTKMILLVEQIGTRSVNLRQHRK